jgi:hypothetical protein
MKPLEAYKQNSQQYVEDRERFTRLAMAILKPKYKFEPQRRAVAAKMFTRWMERKQD